MITAVIAGLKEKNGSSRRVEGTVNIPFDLNSAGSRRSHGRPPKPQLEPVQNDVPVFVNGVQNSMATIPMAIRHTEELHIYRRAEISSDGSTIHVVWTNERYTQFYTLLDEDGE
ncbi:Uncharacterized protein Fot_37318 [Forsythia ovata]|uniref:Uncharacterized protein n=1 Tax=Forsythia ovata TaxID=205694 RepID=A0ABD1RZD4_9LAMI